MTAKELFWVGAAETRGFHFREMSVMSRERVWKLSVSRLNLMEASQIAIKIKQSRLKIKS